MNSRQVAHVWAQQTKSSGGRGSNFYFEGATIYSYGSHFPIARFVKPDCVLFTSRDYSSSTSGHKSNARAALGTQRVHVVRNVLAEDKEAHQDNFVALREHIETLLMAFPRKRDKASLLNTLQMLAVAANAYAAEFKLRCRIKLPPDLVAAGEKIKAKIKAREAAEKRKLAKQFAERLEKWLAGEDVGYGFGLACERFRIVGDVVESTRGAEFPVSHCARVWKFIQRIRERGVTWHKNGESCPVGLFQVDSIDAAGNVKAGCHNVEYSEIVRVAGLLGLA